MVLVSLIFDRIGGVGADCIRVAENNETDVSGAFAVDEDGLRTEVTTDTVLSIHNVLVKVLANW